MNLNITGKDFELTDAIKSYTSEKVEKLSKYLGDDFSAVATFEIHGEEQIAELRVTVNGTDYKATTASKDLYSSIDKNIGILEGQIRKSKTKKDKQNMVETVRIQEKELLDFEDGIGGGVVKTILYSVKPMMVDDALILLQDDAKNKFMPFINVETGKVNVIYKLKDGKNFGLLEPEA